MYAQTCESERRLPEAICPKATPIWAARQPKRARKASNTSRPIPAARGSKATRRYQARTFKYSRRHDAYPHRKHDQGGASPGSADQGGPRCPENDGAGAAGSRTSGNGDAAGAAQPLGPPPRRRGPRLAAGRPRRRRSASAEGQLQCMNQLSRRRVSPTAEYTPQTPSTRRQLDGVAAWVSRRSSTRLTG